MVLISSKIATYYVPRPSKHCLEGGVWGSGLIRADVNTVEVFMIMGVSENEGCLRVPLKGFYKGTIGVPGKGSEIPKIRGTLFWGP